MALDSHDGWHLAALLDAAAERYPERPFLCGRGLLCYREVADQSRRAAAWLRRHQVGRGDIVLAVAQNSAELLVTAFAAARVGAIFSILHHATTGHALQQVVAQCQPAVVLFDHTTAHLSGSAGPALLLLAGPAPVPPALLGFDALLEPAPDQHACPAIDLDPVCLVYTSGSTGAPRGVVLSHDNIRFAAAAIQRRLAYAPDDRIGLFLPLAFDYGLYQIFLAALAGACVYLGRPEQVGPDFLTTLADERISILPGVPTIFAVLTRLLARAPKPLPALRCLTNTGDHLPPAYIAELGRLLPHAALYPMYGLTECKRVAILTPAELAAKPGSVGRPLDNTEVLVVGPDGRPLPPGEVGELVVRGRHVAQGYWRAEQETRMRFRQPSPAAPPELWTGDLCKLDAEGYLYVIGRKDSLLKHRGYRISPIEIEHEACAIPGVSEAGVVKSARTGALCLIVSLSDPSLTPRRILALLRERLEPFKIPDHVLIAPELPKTRNRKLDRKQLAALVEEGHRL